MGGSYYSFPCLILSTGKDCKTSQRYPDVLTTSRRIINQAAGGKLRDRNAKESWALIKELSLYDNESWNDPRDFVKPVKAISLPQDVPSTSDHRLTKLENQVQHLMEAHIAPMQPTQVNKITFSFEICSGPHDTQHCMENPEQAFFEYTSSRTDEAGARAVIDVHEGKLSLRVDTIKHDRKWTKAEDEGDSNKVQAVSFYPRTDPIKPLEWKAPENRLKPSSVEPPELELKELSEHLEYAFLQENNKHLVVISSMLSAVEKARLLEVLKIHKEKSPGVLRT
ncbi:hypothetical protein Tco_0582934 [Tanacetum coccineum]